METKGKVDKPAGQESRVITLRLDRERLERLRRYCTARGWSRNRAVREFIDLLAD